MIRREFHGKEDDLEFLKFADINKQMVADSARYTAINTPEAYALMNAGFACRFDLLDDKVSRLQMRLEKFSRYGEVSVNKLLDTIIERNELEEQWKEVSHNRLSSL